MLARITPLLVVIVHGAVDAGFGVVRIGMVILGAYRTHFVL